MTGTFEQATKNSRNATATHLFSSGAYTTHTVKSGESLALIARQVGLNEVDGVILLLELNPDLRSRCYGEYEDYQYMNCLLNVGETISIPVSFTETPSLIAISTKLPPPTTVNTAESPVKTASSMETNQIWCRYVIRKEDIRRYKDAFPNFIYAHFKVKNTYGNIQDYISQLAPHIQCANTDNNPCSYSAGGNYYTFYSDWVIQLSMDELNISPEGCTDNGGYIISSEESLPPDTNKENIIWARPIDSMTMVYIPAGKYKMGSENGDNDEVPIHTISVNAFWMDTKEISNAQFLFFIEETQYITDAEKDGFSYAYVDGEWTKVKGLDWQHPISPDRDIGKLSQHPVQHVSWNDAQAYCEWASGRLPTEAEWERAARGGVDGQEYIWGNDFDGTKGNFCDKYCTLEWASKIWYDGHIQTSPVASFSPNDYGLYDMAGNVWEWVADWYDKNYYASSPISNPEGPATGSVRAMRGGSWNQYGEFLRSANRGYYYQDGAGSGIGFRCVVPDAE